MRVMIDTNIFISAVLFPNGKASAALRKALVSPYKPVTCDYIIDELHGRFFAVNGKNKPAVIDSSSTTTGMCHITINLSIVIRFYIPFSSGASS